MKEMKYKLPNDAESVTVKVEDGYVVALYEPKKKELKFGDFVRLNKSANTGIIATVGNYDCLVSVNGILFRANKNDISEASEDEKNKIQKFLDDNNLVIDYDKKEIRNKRWRAEINEIYYHIGENGIVIKDMEFYIKSDDNRYEIGNYFRTREQAESVTKEVKAIFDKHKND